MDALPEMQPQLLYADGSIAVCIKQPGQLSEAGNGQNLPELLSAKLRALGKPDTVATVHRLDKIVGGLMVFSTDRACTAGLISDIAERRVGKEYYAVLRGTPEQTDAVLEDLLFRDASKNKSYVVDRMRKGVREAKLAYRVLGTAKDGDQELTLVRVKLYTGRTHQIRVQFSSRRLPLLGDIRYGSKDSRCKTALWSCMLQFRHPKTNTPMTFYQRPPTCFPWDRFPDAVYTEHTVFSNDETDKNEVSK